MEKVIKKYGSFTYYKNGKAGYWRRSDGTRMANGNRIKFGNGNYKQFNSDGSVTDLMVNGKFTKSGNTLSNEDRRHMQAGHVYDKAISDVNGQVYSRARSIRQDQGKSDLANNTFVGWRDDIDFNTNQKSYTKGVSYNEKQEKREAKVNKELQRTKTPKNWLNKATEQFQQERNRSIMLENYEKNPTAVENLSNKEKEELIKAKEEKNRRQASYKTADAIANSAVGTMGAVVTAPMWLPAAGWAGRSLLSNAKYMLQHPVESFVVMPKVQQAADYAINAAGMKDTWYGKGLSTASTFLISPTIGQLGRRYIGTKLQNKLVSGIENNTTNKFLNKIPQFTQNTLTNSGLHYQPGNSFLGNMGTGLIYNTPGAAVGFGVGASNLEELKRTGIEPLDYTTSALLYGATGHMAKYPGRVIRNVKLASGGNQKFNEGIINVLNNFKQDPLGFFKEQPNFKQYYTMTIQPSEKHFQTIDNSGTNFGQGGGNAFANKNVNGEVPEIGQRPYRNYNNMKEGQTVGDEEMTLLRKGYVGRPVTKQSTLQEALAKEADVNFPEDVGRQASGSRQAIVNSYGETITKPKQLIDEGFTEVLKKDGTFGQFTEDPRSLNGLHQIMGRGDFRQKGNYTYNSAGQRIVGIFKNPKTGQYKIFLQDPSGIGSVVHQDGGINVVKNMAQNIADSDNPFIRVFKSMDINNEKDFKTFANRYMQTKPNKDYVAGNVKDIVKSFFGIPERDINQKIDDLTYDSWLLSHSSDLKGGNSSRKGLTKAISSLKNANDQHNQQFENFTDIIMHPIRFSQSQYDRELALNNLRTKYNIAIGQRLQGSKNLKQKKQTAINSLGEMLGLDQYKYGGEIILPPWHNIKYKHESYR